MSKRRRGLIVGSSVLFVLLAGSASYIAFWIARPIGDGPAGPELPRALFARPWAERPVLLLGLGDSVTAGFGASEGHSYFDRLIQNPADEWPALRGVCLKAVLPNLRSINRAVSGSTSLEHLESQLRSEPKFGAETLGLVVLATGGNDLIHNYGRTPPREGAMSGATLAQAAPWIRAFGNRLDAMIERLEHRFPGGCHIFLANIYDPTDGVGDIENAGLPRWPEGLKVLRAYNAAIESCARTHPSVHLIDIHRAFLGHGIHCTQFWQAHYRKGDPHYWYFENLEDPNDRGYDAIRRLFLQEIGKVLAAAE